MMPLHYVRFCAENVNATATRHGWDATDAEGTLAGGYAVTTGSVGSQEPLQLRRPGRELQWSA